VTTKLNLNLEDFPNRTYDKIRRAKTAARPVAGLDRSSQAAK
jgi:hypothetical protein